MKTSRELAQIWGVSQRHVTNILKKVGKGRKVKGVWRVSEEELSEIPPPPRRARKRRRYEYRILSLDWESDAQSQLNEMGEAGWALASVGWAGGFGKAVFVRDK